MGLVGVTPMVPSPQPIVFVQIPTGMQVKQDILYNLNPRGKSSSIITTKGNTGKVIKIRGFLKVLIKVISSRSINNKETT